MTNIVLSSSRIFIDDIRIHAYHGVLPQERTVGGDYTVSVSADYDISDALETDDVADTLDYSALSDIVSEEMAVPSFLVEQVAGRIASPVLREFPAVTSVTVRVVKLNPPMRADCAGAGVEINLINEKTL